jgi:hypothetical protein
VATVEVVPGLVDVEVVDSCVLLASFEDAVVGQIDLEHPSLWPLRLERPLFRALCLSVDRASVFWPMPAFYRSPARVERGACPPPPPTY